MVDISQRFFHYLPDADVREYTPPPPQAVYPQAHGGSCVAACVRMILRDHGFDQPEAYIRDAVGVDALTGGYIAKVPDGLTDLEFPRPARYQERTTLPELQVFVATNAAIAGVKLEGYGSHALVVDGFAGDYVCVRDPLPVGAGSTYRVHQDDFCRAWSGKTVVIR
jgi:ABC-type bacteriocin/lantibiotic exporter with double-glycine peptidase domain